MIVDTRDNLRQQFFCCYCNIDSLKRLASEALRSCDATSRGLVIN
jgi:hypothetical protein